MRVAKVMHLNRIASAVLDGDRLAIIGDWLESDASSAPFAIPAMSLGSLRQAARSAREMRDLAEVALLPPAGPLSKVVCLGLNYRTHLAETHNDKAENPSLFTKMSDALVGHDSPIVRPRVSEHFDYEGEIAVIIGKGGRHIAAERALDHVFGYTIMLDGSVRDYQKHSVSAGKNFWHSGSLGPWIITADEIPDPKKLELETRLNGQIVQTTTADLMIYDIPRTIEYISRWTPLAAGDVIATGTPGGVGSRRTPPLWMRAGDRIEVEVAQIGVLGNDVIDEG